MNHATHLPVRNYDPMPPIHVPRILVAFATEGEAVVYRRDGEGHPAVVMKVKERGARGNYFRHRDIRNSGA